MQATQKQLFEGGTWPHPNVDPAKEEMVARYLPLVRVVAEKVHRRVPRGVDLESLVHSGVVGLLEALERFDPRRCVEFEDYARFRIHGEVMQCLRSLDWVSRSVRSWGRKIDAARSNLAGKLVREPNAEEMAKALEIPLETYFRLDQQVNEATLLSIEVLSIASEAEWAYAQEKFSHFPFIDPLSLVENKDLLTKLASAVENLPERERMIVTLYYHEELTLREIGEILNLSEGRVCQIVSQVVARLRGALGIDPGLKDCAPARRQEKARKEKHMSLGKERISRVALGDTMQMSDGFKLSVPNRKSEAGTMQQWQPLALTVER
jgi:RNA polymerase sigma factor for flagellar operon FliA